MSSKRTPINRPAQRRITPQVIAAWQACDERALACALHLNPFGERSPLPAEITASGVSPDLPPYPDSNRPYDKAYDQTLALQRELLELAGWPDCRAAYARNLHEAEAWRDYCARLVRDPDARHQGTGMDDASLKQELKEARAKVTYRKKLLAELDAKEKA